MTRKCLFAAVFIALLGGIAATTRPLLAQYGPGPGPCFAPPVFKPIIAKYPGGIVMPPAQPPEVKVKSSGPLPQSPPPLKPPEVKFESSGPLPKLVLPGPANNVPQPSNPDPEDPTEEAQLPPKKVSPPPTVEPPFDPLPPAVDIKPSEKPKKSPPPVTDSESVTKPTLPYPGEPVPELPPLNPLDKPGQGEPSFPKPLVPPAGLEKVPPLSESIKPIAEPIKPVDFTVPAGKQTSPWVIQVKVIPNGTHLIATSKNVEFHVECQNLNVQSPTGDIQAKGDIKVSAAGLDMTCEQLTISWQNDWVVMEGKVRLLTEKGSQQLELTGDKLQLKLTTMIESGALKALKSPWHKSAYPPPVTDSCGPAPKLIVPTPNNPISGAQSKQPYIYKRVTEDD